MKRVSPWAIAAVSALLPSAVIASAVIAESIEEMTRNAPMVVHGRVGQVQVQLDEQHGRIFTYADVRVIDVLKGPKVASVLIRTPGGEIAGRGQAVAGAEHFTAGQDTVLFLEPLPDEPGVWICRALAAGKVDLETSKTGDLRAVRHLEGLAFFQKGTIHPVHPEDELGAADAFLTRVRNAVKGGAR